LGFVVVGCGVPLHLTALAPVQKSTSSHMWGSESGVVCQLLDAEHEPVGDRRSCRSLDEEHPGAAAGNYLRITPQCSEPVDLPVRKAKDEGGKEITVVEFHLGWPDPATAPEAYYGAGGEHGKHVATARVFEHSGASAGGDATLWRNTRLRLVATLPDLQGNCSLALVVRGGGEAELTLDGFWVVAKSDLGAKPHGRGLTPRQHQALWAEEEAERDREVRAKELHEALGVSEIEIAAGTCTPGREAKLKENLAGLEAILRRQGMRLKVNDLGVAVPEGTTFSWEVSTGGRYHVFTLAFAPVRTRTLNVRGKASGEKSPHESILTRGGWYADSAFAIFNAQEQFSVETVGSGCFMVAVFHVQ
jgi:hypothetical protein